MPLTETKVMNTAEASMSQPHALPLSRPLCRSLRTAARPILVSVTSYAPVWRSMNTLASYPGALNETDACPSSTRNSFTAPESL